MSAVYGNAGVNGRISTKGKEVMGKNLDFILRLKMAGHQNSDVPPEIVRNEMLSGYLHPGLHQFLKQKGLGRKKGGKRA